MIKKNEDTGFLAFFKFPKPFIPMMTYKYKNLSNNAKLMTYVAVCRLRLSINDKEECLQYYTSQLMIDFKLQ